MTIEKRVRALLEEQKDDYRALVDALRTAAAGTLAEMARHESARVRGAVAEAIGGCNEPGVLALATDLASDASAEVRSALARTVAATPKWDVEAEAMRRLLVDAKSEVRRDAVKAAAARGGFVEDLLPFRR